MLPSTIFNAPIKFCRVIPSTDNLFGLDPKIGLGIAVVGGGGGGLAEGRTVPDGCFTDFVIGRSNEGLAAFRFQ